MNKIMKIIAFRVSLYKINNYISTVIHGISNSFLILSKTFSSAKEETHIQILDIDSYTYLHTVNVIMIVLLNQQSKWGKYFKRAALIYVLIVTGSVNYRGDL